MARFSILYISKIPILNFYANYYTVSRAEVAVEKVEGWMNFTEGILWSVFLLD
jgi:hypothetical protein